MRCTRSSRNWPTPNGACPLHDLNLEILQPFSHVPSAPYRMDLALTYRCNDNCAHCYNARPRNYPELDTAAWMRIIDRRPRRRHPTRLLHRR